MSAEPDEAAHVAATAALEQMGPARLRTLLGLRPAVEIWGCLTSGRARQLAADAERARLERAGRLPEDGTARHLRLFPDTIVEGWQKEARSTPHTPEEMARRLAALDVRVLTFDTLPEPLVEDPDPPGALFLAGAGRGTRIDPARARVAIVGTRRASEYGLRIARCLGRDLAAAGVEVVSGLALGIDAAAHAGALDAPGGVAPPVAVIGAGHDRPCPSRNRGLARAVGRAGRIMSEVPPGIASAPWRYPVRNRLIAGLADVVVVVESASSGGSMSTVAEALARDRVVMAVPGPVGRRTAEGCHDLIRDGAEVCTGAHDVLTSLGLLGYEPVPPGGVEEPGSPRGPVPGSAPDPLRDPGADTVLELLADGPCSIDALATRSGMDLARLSCVLAELVAGSRASSEAGWITRIS